MNFLVVGGFLGSGKTSFILRLAHHMIDDLGINKIVILENEIGEIGIDDQVLRGSGYEVKGMFSGCVCCTMAGELPTNVKTIEKDLNPDWIIMEATGMAFPQNVKENLADTLGISQPNATYKVNNLTAKGYVHKTASEDDRRECRLQVSEKFHSYYDSSDSFLQPALEKLRSEYTEEELKKFETMLASLNEAVAASDVLVVNGLVVFLRGVD